MESGAKLDGQQPKKVSLFIFDFHYVFNEPKNNWIQDSRNKYTNLGHFNDNDKRR